MSTKEAPGPFDGLERAKPGEPVFTLRAHDELAPGLVHKWVELRRASLVKAELPDDKRELELIQCREAEEIAFAMVDWRKGVDAVPVATPAEAKRYSGHATSADELAAKLRHDTLKEAARVMHNAVAEVTNAAEGLRPFMPEAFVAELIGSTQSLKLAAYLTAPKRASYAHKERLSHD